MKQYLLSIYQPDGPPPADLDLNRIMRDVHALRDEMKRAGAWVFSGGLHDASTATVVRVNDRRTAHHRRPLYRRQGTPRWIHDHQGCRSRRRARMGAQARDGALAARDRSAAVPRRSHALSDSPVSTTRSRGSFVRSTAAAVAVLVRRFGDIDLAEEAVQDAFAMAVQQWPSEGRSTESGRVAHHDGAESHHRPSTARGVARRSSCTRRS